MPPHHNRILVLQDHIRQRGLAAAFLHLSRDIYYYTGTAQPGWLVVTPDRVHLFLRSGLGFALGQSTLAPDQISRESNLARIIAAMVSGDTSKLSFGAELDVMTVPQFQKLQASLGTDAITDISPLILSQRMVKDQSEIATIRKAAVALDAGHRAAMQHWRAGISELDASAIVENGQRRAGHEGVYFVRQPDFTMGRGPLASGDRIKQISGVVFTLSGTGLSAAIPAGASHKKIDPGDLVIVDIPTCVEGYHGDQTRTYSFGPPDSRVQNLYRALRQTADLLIGDISPAMTSGDIFEKACFHAENQGIGDLFLMFPDQGRAHFVGHGVGLDLNEPPFLSKGSRDAIRAGMVLAIELHLFDPQIGMVKLEDMIAVHAGTCQILTLSPREIGVITIDNTPDMNKDF